MSYTEQDLNEEVLAKGLTAPRLTSENIDATIVGDKYYLFPRTTHTVCCLTLKNGHTVVGESACVSPENFDREIGEKVAFEDARQKVWALEGYLLRERLNPV